MPLIQGTGSGERSRSVQGLRLPDESICDTCRHLVEGSQFWPERVLREYRHAARDGCRMCGALVASIEAILPAAACLDSTRVWLDQERDSFDVCTSGVVIVMLEPSDLPGARVLLKIFRTSENESPDLPLGVASMVPQMPTDAVTLDRARRWIKSCQQSHPSCVTAQNTMPDRLVDVGFNTSNTDICVCENPMKVEPYIALSHCWGDPTLHAEPLKLLSSNVAMYRNCVPWSLLSRTFKDAIWFCQTLGIRYIWIDSLCIIQDNATDWEQQAAQMASIYRSAWVTLAASAAVSGAAGFLGSRPGSVCATPGLHVRTTYGHGAWEPAPLSSGDTSGNEDLPALRRAWCMQERLISPRVLHFTGEEVVFECCEGTACECGDFPRLLDPRSGRLAWKSHFHKSQDWYQLLVRYTAAGIKKAHDWLPALAGIASAFSRPGVTYLAGLWSDELLYGMSWQHRDPVPCARPELGPSFSWVHVPGPVRYESTPGGRSELTLHALVLDTYWQSNSTNPYVGSGDAFVDLEASLIPVECYMSTVLNGARYDPFMRFKVTTLGDQDDEERDGMAYPDVVGGLVTGSRPSWLPLWSFPSALGHVVGLLVEQIDTGEYKRVGLGLHGFGHKFREGEKEGLMSLCPRVKLRLV